MMGEIASDKRAYACKLLRDPLRVPLGCTHDRFLGTMRRRVYQHAVDSRVASEIVARGGLPRKVVQ